MNSLRRFYINHPKFRKHFDKIETWINWANVFSYILSFLFVLLIIILSYINLPEDIRTPATTIIGGLLSISIFPLIINCINKRTEIQKARFERLRDFYIELCKHIIDVLKTEDEDKIAELSNFIRDNYPIICIDIPQKLSESLLNLTDECNLKFSLNVNANFDMDTLRYFAERSIRIIRKQGNVEGKFHLYRAFTKKVD